MRGGVGVEGSNLGVAEKALTGAGIRPGSIGAPHGPCRGLPEDGGLDPVVLVVAEMKVKEVAAGGGDVLGEGLK